MVDELRQNLYFIKMLALLASNFHNVLTIVFCLTVMLAHILAGNVPTLLMAVKWHPTGENNLQFSLAKSPLKIS